MDIKKLHLGSSRSNKNFDKIDRPQETNEKDHNAENFFSKYVLNKIYI